MWISNWPSLSMHFTAFFPFKGSKFEQLTNSVFKSVRHLQLKLSPYQLLLMHTLTVSFQLLFYVVATCTNSLSTKANLFLFQDKLIICSFTKAKFKGIKSFDIILSSATNSNSFWVSSWRFHALKSLVKVSARSERSKSRPEWCLYWTNKHW